MKAASSTSNEVIISDLASGRLHYQIDRHEVFNAGEGSIPSATYRVVFGGKEVYFQAGTDGEAGMMDAHEHEPHYELTEALDGTESPAVRAKITEMEEVIERDHKTQSERELSDDEALRILAENNGQPASFNPMVMIGDCSFRAHRQANGTMVVEAYNGSYDVAFLLSKSETEVFDDAIAGFTADDAGCVWAGLNELTELGRKLPFPF